jgi:hypothetical protein
MNRSIWRSRWWAPALAVAVGLIAAALPGSRSDVSAADETTGPSATGPGPANAGDLAQEASHGNQGHEDAGDQEGQLVEGRVLETIDVANYTYLRLAASDGTELWAAIPLAKVATQSQVVMHDAQPMHDFTSPTLKRTFATIYFGNLGANQASEVSPTGDQPHPMPATTSSASSWHDPKIIGQAAGSSIPAGKLKPAEGPTGLRVSELRQRRRQLVGQSVKVRGIVVKTVPGVLDRTFVHVRDGSGRADGVEDDLTITTTTTPETGKALVFEGLVAVERDFGSGYRYDVLLENARVVGE